MDRASAHNAAKCSNNISHGNSVDLCYGSSTVESKFLRCDSQSGFCEPHAPSRGVIHHFTNVAAAGGQRQAIHARHLLTESPDVKIVYRFS